MSPLTTTPRFAASPKSPPTVGPSGRSSSSASPRQSVKNRWSPARSSATSSTKRAKYVDPCTSGRTALPVAHAGSVYSGLPRSAFVRNQSSNPHPRLRPPASRGTVATSPGSPPCSAAAMTRRTRVRLSRTSSRGGRHGARSGNRSPGLHPEGPGQPGGHAVVVPRRRAACWWSSSRSPSPRICTGELCAVRDELAELPDRRRADARELVPPVRFKARAARRVTSFRCSRTSGRTVTSRRRTACSTRGRDRGAGHVPDRRAGASPIRGQRAR